MNLAQIQARAALELKRRDQQRRQYEEQLKKYELTEQQRKSFLNFVLYTKSDYRLNWHHKFMCLKLEAFTQGLIKNLMFFLPPQHGKSELVSRRAPAYMLGKNPDLKFLGVSYSSELSKSFNRDCQKIMKSAAYAEVFQQTDHKDVSGFRYAERADYFEIVGHEGSYKSVGVEGAVTGFSADVLSIDDPVKGPREANSPTERENLWRFYNEIIETRCHNGTQKLLTMTRWNEDDLAGRILANEPGKWEVVIFPAVKEDNENPDDPRKIGEALWPEKHSLERLLEMKRKSYTTFVSLYQQRPAPEEGNIFKGHWFKYFHSYDLPAGLAKHFYSDTAYGKEKSDESATMNYLIHNGNLYIFNMLVVNLSFPEFLKAYKGFIIHNGYTQASRCIFEPKATGISTVQQLQIEKLPDGSRINVIEDAPPTDDKTTRAKSAAPVAEAGRVYLLANAPWVSAFITECKNFPNSKKDNQVDCLTGVIRREFPSAKEYQVYVG